MESVSFSTSQIGDVLVKEILFFAEVEQVEIVPTMILAKRVPRVAPSHLRVFHLGRKLMRLNVH